MMQGLHSQKRGKSGTVQSQDETDEDAGDEEREWDVGEFDQLCETKSCAKEWEPEPPPQGNKNACLQDECRGVSPLGQWCAHQDRQRIDPGRKAFESPSEKMDVEAVR